MSSSDDQYNIEIREAAKAVGNALASYETYALVGGGACVVLGSTRITQDVDIVVPRGGTPAARQLLRASAYFEVEARTNHTAYKAERPVEIEILAPPALFQEPFDHKTELITVEGVKEKKGTDLQDIYFLLNYCAQHPEHLPKVDEVPKATKELVHNIIQLYGGQDAWERAGYDLETGRFTRK